MYFLQQWMEVLHCTPLLPGMWWLIAGRNHVGTLSQIFRALSWILPVPEMVDITCRFQITSNWSLLTTSSLFHFLPWTLQWLDNGEGFLDLSLWVWATQKCWGTLHWIMPVPPFFGAGSSKIYTLHFSENLDGLECPLPTGMLFITKVTVLLNFPSFVSFSPFFSILPQDYLPNKEPATRFSSRVYFRGNSGKDRSFLYFSVWGL